MKQTNRHKVSYSSEPTKGFALPIESRVNVNTQKATNPSINLLETACNPIY